MRNPKQQLTACKYSKLPHTNLYNAHVNRITYERLEMWHTLKWKMTIKILQKPDLQVYLCQYEKWWVVSVIAQA